MTEQTLDNSFSPDALVKDPDRDLGFGSVVSGQSRQRLLNPDGTFNVQRSGLPLLSSLNLYHLLLSMKWSTFLGLVLLLYSIGYGTIHPVGVIPNLLVTIESYYSLIANALITGVVFARFARPTARVLFSEVAVIAPYQDKKGLMFRMVNGRSNQLIEVEVKVLFARFVNENGRSVRRFDFLELERDRVTFFPLAWTVVHPIDERSPLFGLSDDDYVGTDAEILILLSATDETFSQVVHTRSSYKPHEIRCGHKFVSIYNEVADGEPISIDIRKLSRIEPA